jgi:hypothetical protein
VAITLVNRMVLLAGVLLAGSIGMVGAPSVRSDPFGPAENQFVHDVRSHMQSYDDTRVEGMSDAALAGEGWFVCHEMAVGVSPQQLGIDQLIARYAKVDLCPNGCPQGCKHSW